MTYGIVSSQCCYNTEMIPTDTTVDRRVVVSRASASSLPQMVAGNLACTLYLQSYKSRMDR